MEREEIQKRLKKELDKNRYEHTLGVMYTAGSLAMAYGYDYEKAMIAGLLHDCAKCLPTEKKSVESSCCPFHFLRLLQLPIVVEQTTSEPTPI